MVTLNKLKFTVVSPVRKNARKDQPNIEKDNVNERNVKSRYSSFAETAMLSSLLEDLQFLASESKAGLKKENSRQKLCIDNMIIGRQKEIISQKELFAGKNCVKDTVIIDHYGDRGKYTGEISMVDGEPNGYGVITYDDGRCYEGDWRDGKFHGKGKMMYSSGDIYVGDYRFDLMHGKGKYVWKDGRGYDGEFSNDKRHGNGKYSWPDGSFYTGSFRTGEMHGYGSFTYPCGTKYNGEFRDGHQHGHGELLYGDGKIFYNGKFSKGLKHGFGTEFLPCGTIRHKGLWHNGGPLGQSIEMSRSQTKL